MNIEELLQTMMGGTKQADADEGGLADLLKSLLGADKTAGGFNPADLIQGLLKGGSGGGGSTFGITEDADLSPDVAQSALGVIVGKLMGARQPATDATAEPAFESGIGGATSAESAAADLPALIERMRGGASVDAQALSATGLPQELAAKAGIDLPQAIKAIQAILGLLTGNKTTTTKRRSSRSTSGAAKSRSTQGTSRSKSTSKKSSSSSTNKARSKSTKADDAKPASRARKSSSASTESKPATKKRPSTSTRKRKPAGTTTPKKRTSGEDETSGGGLDNILDKWSVSG